MRLATAFFCLLAVTGCDEGSPTGPTVTLNERFTLAPGATASIDGSRVRLEFVGVTGDSRCPGDAICITGGDAIVQVRASGEGASTTLDLHTGDSSRATAAYGGFRVSLVELQPYPFSSRGPITPGDYRATLQVTVSR
jgi:hypothetical protein